jgi:hypothetical protein
LTKEAPAMKGKWMPTIAIIAGVLSKTVTPGKRSPRTISIRALPLSVAAFRGAKKYNPCLRKVLLVYLGTVKTQR